MFRFVNIREDIFLLGNKPDTDNINVFNDQMINSSKVMRISCSKSLIHVELSFEFLTHQ